MKRALLLAAMMATSAEALSAEPPAAHADALPDDDYGPVSAS